MKKLELRQLIREEIHKMSEGITWTDKENILGVNFIIRWVNENNRYMVNLLPKTSKDLDKAADIKQELLNHVKSKTGLKTLKLIDSDLPGISFEYDFDEIFKQISDKL